MNGNGRAKVLIADDEQIVREALAGLIEGDESLAVVAQAEDATRAVELAAEHRPDVALVDVKMPGGGGTRAARGIHEASPGTRVLALSAYEDRATVLEMLRAGASGYLVKGSPAGETLQAIHRCLRGQSALSVQVTADVIDELVESLDRSERQALELRDLDRTKSEMIQVLSHELFTPITAIQGFASTMASLKGEISDEELERMAESVSRASARLRRLVTNVATAARLDHRGVEIETKPVPPAEIVTKALDEFPLQLNRFLVFPDTAEGAQVWADADLATQALVVLLENAVDLSPGDEHVEIQFRVRADMVDIRVLDRGPGVPPDMRERIFEAFRQGDSTTTRGHQGLGIGLFLARRIMEAHGGSVEVLPRMGGGSTFILSFRALQPAGID